MKATIKPIEITEDYFNKHNNIKNNKLNLLDIDYNVDLFVYTYDDDSDLFRLVLEWWYRVKNEDKTFNIFTLEATQEIMIQYDNDNDNMHLRNTIGTAEMRFMDKIKERQREYDIEIQQLFSNPVENLVSEVLRLTKH